jgi:hypothetical protein
VKNSRTISIALAAFLFAAALALAQPKPASGFDQLKSLVGTWEGTNPSGNTVRVSYELASGGSALLEHLRTGDEPEMLTVYTADGSRIAMTHYCSANNQPQMQTAPISGAVTKFTFSFVRITNLASAGAGHMQSLVVTIQDKDHFTQEWTWVEKGQSKADLFKFTRKS